MTEAAKGDKAAGATEKDPPARSAEPSTRNRNEKRDYQEMVDASVALFEVPSYVVVGAAVNAGMNIKKPISEQEMKVAIDEFLTKEVE